MTAVCVVVIIALLLAFMFWLVSKDRPSAVKQPDDLTPPRESLKHCFHPEDGTPHNQKCCDCGQCRMSLRPLNGHGDNYTVETDIVDEECYRRCFRPHYIQ